MFSTKRQLLKRTPENGTDRENYLSLLVDEYIHSSSFDAKCQVLANLANFAYDPINYAYIRDVGVLDIFLHVMKHESSHKLLNFALAGVCNLCLDRLNIEYILNYGILDLLLPMLSSEQDDRVVSALTILIQVNNVLKNPGLFKTDLKQHMEKLQTNENKIIANLSSIFIQDVYS